MTSQERAELRARIDAALRARLAVPADGINHGTHYAYRRQRCRCETCRMFIRDVKRRARAAA